MTSRLVSGISAVLTWMGLEDDYDNDCPDTCTPCRRQDHPILRGVQRTQIDLCPCCCHEASA